MPLARAGSATAVLDNTGHEDQGRERGTKAKEDLNEVVYRLAVPKPFDRDSHDGGYLILGTDIRIGKWEFDGVPFPNNDPPAWVSSVADGVRPSPEGLDTHPIRLSPDLWIAVVWIPPTPTPPCNAHGTVYERVSGRTVSVGEPLRLAQLFARGDGAHEHAQGVAAEAVASALDLATDYETPFVRFALSLRATGYEPDIVPRLFSHNVYDVTAAAGFSSTSPRPAPAADKRAGMWWGTGSTSSLEATGSSGDNVGTTSGRHFSPSRNGCTE